MDNNPLLEINNVKKHFPVKGGFLKKHQGSVKAVDGISIKLLANETFGLVGESGCGKSTLGRMIVRLLKPSAGQIKYQGQDIFNTGKTEKIKLNREVQMIFQDPFSSLNPRQKIGSILEEPLIIHNVGISSKSERMEKVAELMEKVGLDPGYINRYPHEFSGGQRQRIGIARALALNPKLIVCDEPVSALDVSVQSQIINLLEDLQAEFGISYLFIAHDLGVVKHISHRVGVMYLGHIMEMADADELFYNPRHPYTKSLLTSIPISHPGRKKERILINSDIPSPANPPPGCKFNTRCPYSEDKCRKSIPNLTGNYNHLVACHLFT